MTGRQPGKVNSIRLNFVMNVILTMSSFIFPLITFRHVSGILLPVGTGRVAFATSLISYFNIFAQLGIPSGALLLAAALDVVTDFFDTGFNVLLLNLEMVREAHIIGRIDRKILTADR